MNCSSLILSSLTEFKNYFVDYNKIISWKALNCCLKTRRNYHQCKKNVNTYLYPNGRIINVMLYMLGDNDELGKYDFGKVDYPYQTWIN